jgi:hypothetical protein
MKVTITAILLFMSTLTFSQTETFSLKHNPYPKNTSLDVEWCGTQDLDTRSSYLLVTQCQDCPFLITEGNVVYRKFYNKENPTQLYWDIDYFTDNYEDPINVIVVGFKLK